MSDKVNKGESRCILLLVDVENEKIAFWIKGPGDLPELPRIRAFLQEIRSIKTPDGVKLKPKEVGNIYLKNEDREKIYHKIVFINSTNYSQIFWETLFGKDKKATWLSPEDIMRSQRRPKCALTLASLREFIRYCAKSRNKPLGHLGEKLTYGSTL